MPSYNYVKLTLRDNKMQTPRCFSYIGIISDFTCWDTAFQLWDVIFLRNYVGCISCLIETFLFGVFLETKTPYSQLLPRHATVNTTLVMPKFYGASTLSPSENVNYKIASKYNKDITSPRAKLQNHNNKSIRLLLQVQIS